MCVGEGGFTEVVSHGNGLLGAEEGVQHVLRNLARGPLHKHVEVTEELGDAELMCGIQAMAEAADLQQWSLVQEVLECNCVGEEVCSNTSNAIEEEWDAMKAAILAPELYWRHELATRVHARRVQVVQQLVSERPLNEGIIAEACVRSGIIPLRPRMLVAITHRASLKEGRSIWLEVQAGGMTMAGWVGTADCVARGQATYVGVSLKSGHWNVCAVSGPADVAVTWTWHMAKQWDRAMMGLGSVEPVDVGAEVLRSLPEDFYAPQSEQPPGYATMFSGYGPVELMLEEAGWECDAYCEWETHLAMFLRSKHPRAAYAKDAKKLAEDPMSWGIAGHRLPHLRALIGGPPCQAMSKAGMQKGAADPRSERLYDMFHVGAAYNVERILLENVTELMDDDDYHGLFSAIIQLAASYKFQLIMRQRVLDAVEGGVTARKRLFLHFEHRNVTLILPQMGGQMEVRRAFKLEETLEKVADLPPHAWLRGRWVPECDVQRVTLRKDAPTRLGTLWFGGLEYYEHLIPGMEVKLRHKKGRDNGIRKWRILLSEYSPDQFLCEDAVRNSNIRTYAQPWEVVRRLLVPVPVYSFKGIAHSITCFTEFCRYGCMAGWDHRCSHIPGWPNHPPIRVFYDKEKARALGVPMRQYDAMVRWGFSEHQLNTVVGNVMAMTMLARVIPPVVFRSRLHWSERVQLAHADAAPLVNLQSQLVPTAKEELVVLVMVDVETLPWLIYTISEDHPVVWGEWRTPAKGAATTWAEGALRMLKVQPALHPRLASNCVGDRRMKVLYVAVQQRKMLEGSEIQLRNERWRPWQQLQQRSMWEVASLAVAAQQQRSANAQVLIPLEVQIRAAAGDGVMPRSRIYRKEVAASVSHPQWHGALTKAEVAQLKMQRRLASVPLGDPQAEW
jgi:site-specific DNA-cytosine methylase